MCVIMACTKQRPSYTDLWDASVANRDGAGVAWIKDGRVYYRKGIRKIKNLYKITESVPFPFMVHFRMATEGGVSKELCHPFPVTRNSPLATEGSARKVLMHNGHWGAWSEKLTLVERITGLHAPYGIYSDSRAAAWITSVYGEGALTDIAKAAGKFATLTVEGIRLHGHPWTMEKGMTLSNIHFRWKTSHYTGAYDYEGGGWKASTPYVAPADKPLGQQQIGFKRRLDDQPAWNKGGEPWPRWRENSIDRAIREEKEFWEAYYQEEAARNVTLTPEPDEETPRRGLTPTNVRTEVERVMAGFDDVPGPYLTKDEQNDLRMLIEKEGV